MKDMHFNTLQELKEKDKEIAALRAKLEYQGQLVKDLYHHVVTYSEETRRNLKERTEQFLKSLEGEDIPKEFDELFMKNFKKILA